MSDKYKRAFTLMEVVITISLFAVLILITVISYQVYIKKQNANLAKYLLSENVMLVNKYYAEHGAYLENGTWPNFILATSNDGTAPSYTVSFYPANPTEANNHAFCLVAEPLVGTLQYGEPSIYADSTGGFSSNTPSSCSSIESVSQANNCALGVGTFPPCNGNCAGGEYSACSGNCRNIIICRNGSGCSGNCHHSVIYGDCSGNCNNSIIYGSCSGNCNSSLCCDPNNPSNCSSC